jgi:hypothetical protein
MFSCSPRQIRARAASFVHGPGRANDIISNRRGNDYEARVADKISSIEYNLARFAYQMVRNAII